MASSSNLSQTKITSSRKFRSRKITKPIKYSSDSETESIKTKSSRVYKEKTAITRTQKLSDFTRLEGPQDSNRTETNNNQPTFVVGSQVDKIDGIFIWSFLNAQDQASFSAQKLPVESSQQNIPKKNSPTPTMEAENVYSPTTPVAAIPKQIETPSQFLDEGTSYSTQEKTYSSNQLTIDGSNQQKIGNNNSPIPATEAENVYSPTTTHVAVIPTQIETPSRFLDVGTSCSMQEKTCSNNQLTKLTQVCEKSSQTEVPCLNPQRRRIFKKRELLETIASKKYRALRKRLLNCMQQLRQKDIELSLLKKLQARRAMINYTPDSNNDRQSENEIIIPQGVNFLETKSCETCKKEFWLRSSLDFHRCLNGSRPTALSTKLLYCEFCSYESYRGDTMRMHVRIMHGSGTHLDPKLLAELFDDTV